jgi:hypothetical protein
VNISIVTAFKQLLDIKHVSFDDVVLLGIFAMVRLWLGKENLFV